MKVYTLYPPTVPAGTVKFSFTSEIAGDNWLFEFDWRDTYWAVVASLPDGTIREARVVPEVLNWSRFRDYYISFSFASSLVVGLADIENIAIHVFYVQGAA